MQIRKATLNDTAAILNVIAEARTIMRENGNTSQWTDGYPSLAVITDDVTAGNGFVCLHEGSVAGYFCLMTGNYPDPNYRNIEKGSWLNDDPYGVIHRLASARKARGIAQAAFDYAFSIIGNIKVDTHHDNVPMQRFLKKSGFAYCGVIYLSDGSPRDAFQKQV